MVDTVSLHERIHSRQRLRFVLFSSRLPLRLLMSSVVQMNRRWKAYNNWSIQIMGNCLIKVFQRADCGADGYAIVGTVEATD